MDEERQLLRHFLASLAYRTQKALRGASPEFASFRAAPGVRTPHQTLFHMTNVLAAVRWRFTGEEWRPAMAKTFEDEVIRFHTAVIWSSRCWRTRCR
jgi:hypothetical protein